MGRDKALVAVGGVAMAERVARALEAGGCGPVVLVGGDADQLDDIGRPWVGDLHPGAGPVGGVLTALAAVGGADVVVAACDLPDLDAVSVSALLAAASRNPGAEVVAAETERLEPLLAWWPASSARLVQEQFDGGVRALHEVIGRLAAVRQAVSPGALRNVNRPEDLDPRPGRPAPTGPGTG
jgi:molybdopterin-guanine dinucleotide biosynthesis protein A